MQIHNLVDLNKENLDFSTHVKKSPTNSYIFFIRVIFGK